MLVLKQAFHDPNVPKVANAAVYKNVAIFDINFAHQNAFRSCDGNFVHKTIQTERIKHGVSQIELTHLRSKISLALV